MPEDDTNHDNDADKRPRFYGRATGDSGSVEVTVQGSEGESSEDVMERVPDAVSEMKEVQKDLENENGDRGTY